MGIIRQPGYASGLPPSRPDKDALMPVNYRLADHGRTFSTRPRGAELRDEALAAAHGGDVLVLDFADVLSVSYSFADEFVGALAERRASDVSWVNASPEVERVVGRAVARRTGVSEPAGHAVAPTYL